MDASGVKGILAVDKGGTGVGSLDSLKAALKITSIDTINLSKRIDSKISQSDNISFTKDIIVNGINLGKGSGNLENNLAVGVEALSNNTSGYDNTVFGFKALKNNTTGRGNTAFGYQSMISNTIGTENTGIGYNTLGSNTSGVANTAIGGGALALNITGSYNMALGTATLVYNLSGSNNTGSGYGSLIFNTSGSRNAAYGNTSLYLNTTGDNNTAVGNAAGMTNTIGNNNTFIGYYANGARNNLTNTTAIGYNSQVTASNQIQLGDANITDVKTSGVLTASGYKIPNGTSTQYLRADGTVTTSVTAGVPYTGASQAVDLGAYDLKVNFITAGFGGGQIFSNTVFTLGGIGINTTGEKNTTMGFGSLGGNITGSNNNSFGYYSLQNNRAGSYNTSNGSNALFSNVGNDGSVAIGYNAMYYADDRTTGRITGNTAVGYESLKGSTTAANNYGQYNTALGYQSLTSNTTGSSNTAIGYSAMSSSSTYSNSTALGYNAQVTASNQIQLGDANVTDVKTSGVITSRGLGIGTKSNTSAALEVNSSSQGFLPPRMTAAQRDNIVTPVAGLVVWCSNCADFGELQVYNGSIWTNMIGGAVSLVPSSSPPPIAVEASIVFSIDIDPGVSNILAVVGATQAMIVNISSTLPTAGVNLNVVVNKDSDNSTIFSSAMSSTSSVNNITISGLTAGVLCTASVSVTSKSTSANTLTKTFKLARK